MAAIGQIRKHSGLLIVIIGIALAAFVLGDFLKPSRSSQRLYIGEVAGEEISSIDFNTEVEERLETTRNQRQQERLSPQDIFQVKQSVWTQMVEEIVLGKEYDKLGISVTSDELSDQILGAQPHQFVRQSFTNPNTGAYDPEMVKSFLQNLNSADPDMKKRYLTLEAMVKDDHRKNKFQNLLTKAYYVPEQFAEFDWNQKNASAEIRYVASKYSSISDSAVDVTDNELMTYYNDHLYQYEQDETRAIEYVIFEVQPSSDDRKEIASQVNQFYKEFKDITEIATFVNSVSDDRYDSTYKKESDLSVRIAAEMMESPIGTMVGPYVENETYHITKLINRQERPDSIMMSQILISYATAPAAAGINDRTKEVAETLLDSLLKVLNKNPGKFEDIALNFSDYPTVEEDKGEIGWVIDGQQGFNNFFVAGMDLKVNDLDEMETALGYHIIKATEKTDPIEKVRIATITRAIEPSSETFQQVYIEASEFAGENNTEAKFNVAVEEDGLNKRTSDRISEMSNRLAGIENGRQVIRWSFFESTTIGKVSPVFEDEKKYIVAVLTQIREKGVMPFDEVKEQIKPLVINQKKADMLIDQINNLGTTDLNQIASRLNESVDSTNIKFTSRNIPGFGSEYELIGKIFTLEPGVNSGPIKGNNAVFVVQVDEVTLPDTPANYTVNASMLERRFSSRITGNSYLKVLKDQVEIVDNRLLYY